MQLWVVELLQTGLMVESAADHCARSLQLPTTLQPALQVQLWQLLVLQLLRALLSLQHSDAPLEKLHSNTRAVELLLVAPMMMDSAETDLCVDGQVGLGGGGRYEAVVALQSTASVVATYSRSHQGLGQGLLNCSQPTQLLDLP